MNVCFTLLNVLLNCFFFNAFFTSMLFIIIKYHALNIYIIAPSYSRSRGSLRVASIASSSVIRPNMQIDNWRSVTVLTVTNFWKREGAA